jgi:hypothetical protein
MKTLLDIKKQLVVNIGEAPAHRAAYFIRAALIDECEKLSCRLVQRESSLGHRIREQDHGCIMLTAQLSALGCFGNLVRGRDYGKA